MNVGKHPSLGALAPEIILLLACARTKIDNDLAEQIRETARKPLDWERLIYLARGHGLLPLLQKNLDLAGADEVPSAYREQLLAEARRVAARNLLLTNELLELLDAFSDNGIVVMPYKGPAVAVQVYGDLRLRGFVDLDILICRDDLAEVRKVISARGYNPVVELTAAKQRAIFRSECDEVFTRDNGEMLLEVHWAVTPPFFSFPLDSEGLFKRSVQIDLLRRKVLAPSPEDLLLILCVNGTKDIWGRLETICCLAELLRRNPDLSWTRVLEESRRLGAERMLLLGLYLARALFEVPLPDTLAKRIEESSKLHRIAQQVYSRMFEHPEYRPTLFELTVFRLHCRERFRDRLNYCLRRMLTPTYQDVEFLELPHSLEFLYPLLRPLKLIRR